jgi:hypothetical protein
MAKTKKEAPSKGKDLLRDASTGEFYKGTAPKDTSPSGTNAGVDFWEV